MARARAPGLTPRAILEKCSAMQMVDVHLPTTNGRHLMLPRRTDPTREQKLLLHQLNLKLPEQPRREYRLSPSPARQPPAPCSADFLHPSTMNQRLTGVKRLSCRSRASARSIRARLRPHPSWGTSRRTRAPLPVSSGSWVTRPSISRPHRSKRAAGGQDGPGAPEKAYRQRRDGGVGSEREARRRRSLACVGRRRTEVKRGMHPATVSNVQMPCSNVRCGAFWAGCRG